MARVIIFMYLFIMPCDFLKCNVSHQCELYSELESRQICSTMVRPIQDYNAAVEVDLLLMLMLTHEFDERSQIFQATIWLAVYWTDFNMSWNPDNYGGIESAILPLTKLWTPDLCFMNDVTNDKCITVKEERVSINSSGYVTWWISKDVRTQCDVDITRFPFDEQNCSIDVGTWYSSDKLIRLRGKGMDVHLGHYKPGGEWIVVDSWIQYLTFDNFTETHFWLRLHRQPLYNLYYVILPVVLLSVLNVLCFVLPIESGEKIGLSVAIFLSFAVFISMINNNMPRQSNHQFRLGMYMTTELVMSGLTIVMEVFVLRLYHRNTTQVPEGFYKLLMSESKCRLKRKSVGTSYDFKCNLQTANDTPGFKCVKCEETHGSAWQCVAASMDKLCGFIVLTVNVCSLAAYFISVFA